MITAEQAKQETDKAIEIKRKDARAKAKSILNHIEKRIVRAIHDGQTSILLYNPFDLGNLILEEVIVNELSRLGYTVLITKITRNIYISWGDKKPLDKGFNI